MSSTNLHLPCMAQALELQKPSRADVSGVVWRGIITSLHSSCIQPVIPPALLVTVLCWKKMQKSSAAIFPQSLCLAPVKCWFLTQERSSHLLPFVADDISLRIISECSFLSPPPFPKSIVVNNPISAQGISRAMKNHSNETSALRNEFSRVSSLPFMHFPVAHCCVFSGIIGCGRGADLHGSSVPVWPIPVLLPAWAGGWRGTEPPPLHSGGSDYHWGANELLQPHEITWGDPSAVIPCQQLIKVL